MTLHFESADTFGNVSQRIDSDEIKVMSEDGRWAFSIVLNRTGGIEISSIATYKNDGKVFDNRFTLRPLAGNSIEIKSLEYQ